MVQPRAAPGRHCPGYGPAIRPPRHRHRRVPRRRGAFPYPESVELAVARAALGLEEPKPADLPVPRAVADRVVGTYDAADILCRIARLAPGPTPLTMELLVASDAEPYLETPLLYFAW